MPNATYVWQDNSNDSIYQATQTGTYHVNVSVNQCNYYDSIQVGFEQLPVVNLGNDTTVCFTNAFTLDASTLNADYDWHNTSNQPTFNAIEAGTYWVTVSNFCGLVTDTITIESGDCGCHFYVPNSFTPNNDLLNDKFPPVADCDYLAEYSLTIFNRWGEVIFESNNPQDLWDGSYGTKPAPIGVYVYALEYRISGELPERKLGHVTLIR